MHYKLAFISILIFIIMGCSNSETPKYKTIKDELQKHTHLIELQNKSGNQRLLVMPDFQGRIATSTNSGEKGPSLGWLNFNNIEKGEPITGGALHGEERVWIGPLGGQFSFYYGRKKPIHDDNWSVPASFNEEPFHIVSTTMNEIILKKNITLTNFSGTHLNMQLDREIHLFNNAEIEETLSTTIPASVASIGYQTSHTLTNTDRVRWQKATGLASPWSLSTFNGTDKSVTIIPIEENIEEEYYYYLNKFDTQRLVRSKNAIWYRTDGKFRSKLGVPPQLSKGILGCYQPENKTLRIIRFRQMNDSLYFNSEVSIQENPYSGEAIAIYNHGPMDLSVGKENLFFEMETMAAMKEIEPGESIEHYHQVYQFSGDLKHLNAISKKVLGIDLDDNPF